MAAVAVFVNPKRHRNNALTKFSETPFNK